MPLRATDPIAFHRFERSHNLPFSNPKIALLKLGLNARVLPTVHRACPVSYPFETPEGHRVGRSAAIARQSLLAEHVAPADRGSGIFARRTNQQKTAHTPAHHQITQHLRTPLRESGISQRWRLAGHCPPECSIANTGTAILAQAWWRPSREMLG